MELFAKTSKRPVCDEISSDIMTNLTELAGPSLSVSSVYRQCYGHFFFDLLCCARRERVTDSISMEQI